MKTSKEGERLCDEAGCEQVAAHVSNWNGGMATCAEHSNWVVVAGNMVGFPVVLTPIRETQRGRRE